ncbi:hypothetical protein NRK68_19620 [Streptomyces yangpuensis]|uniref:DUF3592 domain-containing protein n=1 Tax=Streptomyces yangpuensis TaxID=1648182 RepID=A0ABY5PYU8_9ACTN|nr:MULTISPECIES: hypothetical protein [Streptomyces]MBZ9597412.1 hypothetical protein [Streptomyces erythrochromogenes]UUY49219.1 hypothetical protein NRK68_19620 [Streptomyces yangpuensis]
MRAVVRGLGRGVAGVGVVVTLVAAGWLMWVLPGPQMGAVLGFGPVDGVFRVHRCYEATDAEGYTTGTDCTGWYTPRRSGEAAREIVLATAAEEYRRGARVEVRTARGRAYELSGSAVFNFGAAAGLLLVPFLTLAAWLFACARTGTVANGDGYFLASLAGLLAAIVLAAGAGLLVGIGTAVF